MEKKDFIPLDLQLLSHPSQQSASDLRQDWTRTAFVELEINIDKFLVIWIQDIARNYRSQFCIKQYKLSRAVGRLGRCGLDSFGNSLMVLASQVLIVNLLSHRFLLPNTNNNQAH